jgi:hypothetical protein
MNYLENGICNFKFIGRTKFYDNGVNIVSITFFKLPTFYKNFKNYINGLKTWIKMFHRLKPNFIIRIFIDNNIYQDKYLMDIINSSKYIEPVLFVCADYILDKYHLGLFASMIRFFPLFNFKNNDAKSVLCADIDWFLKNELHTLYYKYILNNHKNINNITIFSYFYEYYFRDLNPWIQAGLFYIPEKFKYDKNILLDFIQKDNKLKYFNKYADRFKKKSNTSKHRIKKMTVIEESIKSQFPLGIDEIFLNNVLVKSINGSINILIDSNFHYLFYYLVANNKNFHFKIEINNKLYNKEFEESIFNVSKKKYKVKDYFEYMDKNLFTEGKENKLCFNHKIEQCVNEQDMNNEMKLNLELREVFKDFKNKIPKNSNLYEILNSGILNLNKYRYFLNFKFIVKNNKFSYQNYKILYQIKK